MNEVVIKRIEGPWQEMYNYRCKSCDMIYSSPHEWAGCGCCGKLNKHYAKVVSRHVTEERIEE